MKRKALIVCALLALAAGVRAQYGADYYHRTGDTIYTYSDIAFYNWWDFERMDSLREPMDYGGGSILYYYPLVITPYYTTTPLKVVGIAACVSHFSWDTNPAYRPEYVYLFDDGPVFKRRAEVHYLDEQAHRYLQLNINTHIYPYTYPSDSCCRVFPQTQVFKLYESYFDTAVTVTNTFYVGWSNNNYAKHSARVQVDYHFVGAHHNSVVTVPCNELDTCTTHLTSESLCFFPWIDYYYCTDTSIIENPGGEEYEWIHKQERNFYLIYPLIEIDTTVPPAFLCEPVQNLQATVLDTGSGCVFFSWDDFLHYTYCELQYYAPQNGIASAVDTIVSGANILHLCGLDTMLAYYVRARAFCDTSKIETNWSNWVPFSFPHTDPPTPPEPPQGIAEPSVLDRFTHLLPNPAADKVTVMSELGMLHIDVYNARGILVYSEPVGYSSATIDLRGWPAGQYMMSIETRRGKTTKRLVVAR